MKIQDVIALLDMMVTNELNGVEDSIKIKSESYLKGKADRGREIIALLKNVKENGNHENNSFQ